MQNATPLRTEKQNKHHSPFTIHHSPFTIHHSPPKNKQTSSLEAWTMMAANGNTNTTSQPSHTCVVLFYKYFVNEFDAIIKYPSIITTETKEFIDKVCSTLKLKGRILLSPEGINGSLSASNKEVMDCFIRKMEDYIVYIDSANNNPNDNISEDATATNNHACYDDPIYNSIHCDDSNDLSTLNTTCSTIQQQISLFQDIDWKITLVNEDCMNTIDDPFPDLKISIVKEIVSTGTSNISIKDIEEYGGDHLSPKEFHEILQENWGSIDNSDNDGGNGDDSREQLERKQIKTKRQELVVIDVRNTFEYAIGHFLNPSVKITKQSQIDTDGESSYMHVDGNYTITSVCTNAAVNPETLTFSSFDSFGAKHASFLKDKQVLLYCTGGIRCEKASAMLRKRGIKDVKQLSGGIHRYIEKYPNGFFKGKNFVFDQVCELSISI